MPLFILFYFIKKDILIIYKGNIIYIKYKLHNKIKYIIYFIKIIIIINFIIYNIFIL